MTLRIAINGFGRIGRTVLREIFARHSDIQVVAINDIGDPKGLVHLFKYDSVMGRFPHHVEYADGQLHIEGKGSIALSAERDLSKLPWKQHNIDFVVESSGVFRKRSQLQLHLDAGAPKVLLTVPSKDAIDATIVLGVNDNDLKAEHRIISNASCTTNCLAPMAKVLHDTFGIEHGMVTTIHAYTNDQRLLDAPHDDLYRARSAAINIIPTTTGAARATGEVLPALKGRIDGMAMRVPVANGSVVDLVSTLSKEVNADEVNAAFKAAAEGPLKGILQYCPDPIVSTDIIGNTHSSIFVPDQTMVLGKHGKMIKTISWYDNEYGYSCRVVDLIKKSAAL